MFTVNEDSLKNAIDWYKDKLIFDEDIGRAPDGLYAWIWKDDGHDEAVVAAPVTNAQEIGSLHLNLWQWSVGKGGLDVEAAGEFIKEGSRIEFNLQSGTFHKLYLQRLRNRPGRALLIARVEQAFERFGLEPVFRDCEPSGPYPCVSHERLAGYGILSHTAVETKPRNMFPLEKFFTAHPIQQNDRDVALEDLARQMEALGGEVVGGRRRRARASTRQSKKRRAARTRRSRSSRTRG